MHIRVVCAMLSMGLAMALKENDAPTLTLPLSIVAPQPCCLRLILMVPLPVQVLFPFMAEPLPAVGTRMANAASLTKGLCRIYDLLHKERYN